MIELKILILLGLLYEIFYIFKFRKKVKEEYVLTRYIDHIIKMSEKYKKEFRYKYLNAFRYKCLNVTVYSLFQAVYMLHFLILMIYLFVITFLNYSSNIYNLYLGFLGLILLEVFPLMFKRIYVYKKPNFSKFKIAKLFENIYLIIVYFLIYSYLILMS